MGVELRAFGDGLAVETDGERGLKDDFRVLGLNKLLCWRGEGWMGRPGIGSCGGGQTQNSYLDMVSLRCPGDIYGSCQVISGSVNLGSGK